MFHRKLIGVVFLLLLAAAHLFCQEVEVKTPEETECDHTSGYGRRFVNTQLHAPARVTYFDGQKIELVYEFQPGVVRPETWYVSEGTKI